MKEEEILPFYEYSLTLLVTRLPPCLYYSLLGVLQTIFNLSGEKEYFDPKLILQFQKTTICAIYSIFNKTPYFDLKLIALQTAYQFISKIMVKKFLLKDKRP